MKEELFVTFCTCTYFESITYDPSCPSVCRFGWSVGGTAIRLDGRLNCRSVGWSVSWSVSLPLFAKVAGSYKPILLL